MSFNHNINMIQKLTTEIKKEVGNVDVIFINGEHYDIEEQQL